LLGEVALDRRGELGVQGAREHLRELLDHDHLQAAGGQGFGHLQADVPGADDDRCRSRRELADGVGEGERLRHGVQHVDAVLGSQPVEAGDRGAAGVRPGRQEQPVVAERAGPPIVRERQGPLGHLETGDPMVEHQSDAESLEIITATVGEVAPVRHLSGHVVGNTADAEVRVCVGDQQADLHAWIELEAAPGSLDPGIASPDDRYVHLRGLRRSVRRWR
jgi:hypothetical protein